MNKLKLFLGFVLVLAFVALAGLGSGTFTKAMAADQGTISYPYLNNTSMRSGPWARNGITSTVVNISANSRFGVCTHVKTGVVNIKYLYYQISPNNQTYSYPAGTSAVAATLDTITALGYRCATFTPTPSYYIRFVMFGEGTAAGKLDLYLFRQ